MTRPQAFDTQVTIEAALAVFWQRGLHRTSVDDLLAASGLARSSLYNTFGSKQALFEQALQRYVDQQVADFQTLLAARSLRVALDRLFERALQTNNDGRGCLLGNSAAGLMAGDDRERQWIRRGFERMFAVLVQRIEAAREKGELTGQPAEDIAILVCSTLTGLRLFHKSGLPKAKLRRAARLMLDGLLESGA